MNEQNANAAAPHGYGGLFFDRSSHRLRRNPSVAQARQFPLQGSLKRCNRYASLVKGDSPQCGEMSRSDRGDGHRLGGGFAVGELGGIYALATKQSPGLFLPNADAFGASCLLHCVQFTREQAPALPRSDVGIGPYILCFYKPQNIIYTYYNIPPGKIQERRSRGCPAVPPLVFGLIPP